VAVRIGVWSSIPDEALRNRILTDNPQALSGFPAV
jgi:hypothetical protein